MKREMDSFHENKVYTLSPKPHNVKPIATKWVFRIKYDHLGKISKYKARLVAKGFTQTYGKDFYETYAPVVKFKSLHIQIAFHSTRDYVRNNVVKLTHVSTKNQLAHFMTKSLSGVTLRKLLTRIGLISSKSRGEDIKIQPSLLPIKKKSS